MFRFQMLREISRKGPRGAARCRWTEAARKARLLPPPISHVQHATVGNRKEP